MYFTAVRLYESMFLFLLENGNQFAEYINNKQRLENMDLYEVASLNNLQMPYKTIKGRVLIGNSLEGNENEYEDKENEEEENLEEE